MRGSAGQCGYLRRGKRDRRNDVGAGLGADPYTLTGGSVYLTGPYNGTGACVAGTGGGGGGAGNQSCAPFGLSIAMPARVGPFDPREPPPDRGPREARNRPDDGRPDDHDRGDSQHNRRVSPSDPAPEHHDRPAGVHLQSDELRTPSITNATIAGDEGASAAESSSFQAANCAALKFAPKLTASTQAKTSRGGGASLSVKLSYPSGPHDANVAALKVDLPEALPARLRTLRQACLARVFQANPAACPAGSIVGRARVLTPILPGVGGGLLTGPAYFVGRGPGRFPGLVLVLSGDGVRLDLAGRTFIDARTDVTSLTFKTVPDIPVSSLELTLPEGPHSALATNAALCKRKLAMPTALVGQNGAEIHESTKVRVIGCPASRARKPLRRSKHYKP